MSRKIVRLTLDNLEALPAPCRSCLFWENDPVRRSRVEDPDAEKDAWVSHVLREWGSCGRVALVDDEPVGGIDDLHRLLARHGQQRVLRHRGVVPDHRDGSGRQHQPALRVRPGRVVDTRCTAAADLSRRARFCPGPTPSSAPR